MIGVVIKKRPQPPANFTFIPFASNKDLIKSRLSPWISINPSLTLPPQPHFFLIQPLI